MGLFRLLWILTLLWHGLSPAQPATTPTPTSITIEGPFVDNAFPKRLTVTFHIQCPGDPITLVRGKVQYGYKSVREVVPFDFTPGEDVRASWTWDTERLTVPPYVPITLWLEVRTQGGARSTWGPYTVVYEDNRFPWKEKRGSLLILRWYEGDEEFGNTLYAIGHRALERQLQDFGVTLDSPFVVLVYASEEDFFAWHAIRTEWLGGQAFPTLGSAAVIIRPDEYTWAKEVIPHELLHLTLHRVVHNPLGDPPAWFEEGLAQYYEETDHSSILRFLDEAIAQDRVLPLGIMRDPPGQNVDRAYVWYAQALSMVEWLLESRGREALQTYIALMQKPIPPRRAFREAFGMDEDAFYRSWCEHVRVTCPYPTATFTPTPWPTRPPTPTPTLTPSPAPILLPSLTPTLRLLSPTHTPTPTRQPPPPPGMGWVLAFVLVLIVILGIIMGIIWRT